MQHDNSKLAFCTLEFLFKWIARGEVARPPVLLSVDEGLPVAALGTAGRTFNSTLLDASWAILKRSLRQKKAPSPESFLAKIYAHASLSNLQKAFNSLHEFEATYRNDAEAEDLFSPFTSLYPLVVACSEKGFKSLDQVIPFISGPFSGLPSHCDCLNYLFSCLKSPLPPLLYILPVCQTLFGIPTILGFASVLVFDQSLLLLQLNDAYWVFNIANDISSSSTVWSHEFTHV